MRASTPIKPGLIIILMILFTLNGCKDDLIVEDISHRRVSLVSPPNNLETETETITFWWDEVEAAERYNLQVAQPSFDSAVVLVLDTNVQTTKFSYTLPLGSYEWRVRAFNPVSETIYSIRGLTIKEDTVNNLQDDVIILLSPVGGFLSQSKTITFKWKGLKDADSYGIRFGKPDLNEQNIIFDTTITGPGTSFTYTFADEGAYEWGVRGQNQQTFTATPFFTRSFTIDQSPPPLSQPKSPVNDTLQSGAFVQLTWERAAAAVADSVYLYSDSLGATLEVQGYSKLETFTVQKSLTPGSYSWQLKSIDAAGNISGFGKLVRFEID